MKIRKVDGIRIDYVVDNNYVDTAFFNEHIDIYIKGDDAYICVGTDEDHEKIILDLKTDIALYSDEYCHSVLSDKRITIDVDKFSDLMESFKEFGTSDIDKFHNEDIAWWDFE